MDLLDQLIDLETSLHRAEVRRDRQQLEALLHPAFMEIGRSGRRYNRAEVLEELGNDAELPPVEARDFEMQEISQDVLLLTYRSAHIGDNGNLTRHTLRMSLWVRTAQGLQLRYHQGTATD